MEFDWPVSWILSLESLTQDEKEAILWKNLERSGPISRPEDLKGGGSMRSIDIHAHLMPQCLWRTVTLAMPGMGYTTSRGRARG